MAITALTLDIRLFEGGELGKPELPLSSPLKMHALGNTVVLAGMNGAGKSRLLRLLVKLSSQHLHAMNIEGIENTLIEQRTSLENLKQYLQYFDQSAKPGHRNPVGAHVDRQPDE